MTKPANQPLSSPPARRGWSVLWKTPQGIFWSLCYIAAVVFAYQVPPDVLDRYPDAKAFTDFMASWNMQIRRVGEISGPANQINRFVYSVLWCVMPGPWIAQIWDSYKQLKPSNFVVEMKSWFKFWFLTGGTAFFGLEFFMFLGETEVSNRYRKILFIYHLSRSIYAPILVFTSVLTILAFLYFIWTFITKRVRITGGKHA